MNTNEAELAVVVRDLEKRFGKFVAVSSVSFEVARGEIFGFLGSNGAGKSTVIRMLVGLLTPTSGSGRVAGFDVGTEAENIKKHIGYMSQKFSLYEDLTVEENINLYSGIYRIDRAKKKQRKEWVLEMAGLRDHRHSRTSILSAGWKQRLALGCAVLHEPEIIFLDEPTSGVDPISRRQFWDLINDLAGKGVTVFVTTHYMDEAEYCDRLGLMDRGELIAVGTPGSVKADLMKDDILDVHCQRPQDAIADIEQLASVKDVALFGRGLHVVVENAEVAIAEIRKSLESKSFVIERIEVIPPTLEDVFVSLIEARDKAMDVRKVAG